MRVKLIILIKLITSIGYYNITMNLKQLEVFIAVAESGSFSKGAERTFLTQSTVSQHISALEEDFGLKLLDRTGKGALPTEAGKLLLLHARRVVTETRATEQALARFAGLEEAQLRIGGSTIPGDYMVPAILPLLQQRFPGLKLTLLHGDSRDILDKLAQDDIEAGIVGSSFEVDGIDFIPTGKDQLAVIVGRGHRWSARTSVTLAELLEEPFIVREPGSGTGKTVSSAFSGAGITPEQLQIVACLGSSEAVKNAVIAGVGIAFLSMLAINKELESGELAALGVDGIDISRPFYLVKRKGRELSPGATAFINLLQEVYR
jgi:DNA-binding transcriptional LysR family regulator